MSRCESTSAPDRNLDSYRCSRDAGHDGAHELVDSATGLPFIRWARDAGYAITVDATARIANPEIVDSVRRRERELGFSMGYHVHEPGEQPIAFSEGMVARPDDETRAAWDRYVDELRLRIEDQARRGRVTTLPRPEDEALPEGSGTTLLDRPGRLRRLWRWLLG